MLYFDFVNLYFESGGVVMCSKYYSISSVFRVVSVQNLLY